MGYYIFSYGIKTEQIKQVFGCKDETVLQKIKQNSMYDHYRDENVKGEISLEEAIKDIIFARDFNQKMGYQYGYALICICDTFGIKPPNTQEMKFGYETDLFNNCIDEDFGKEDILIEDLMLCEELEPFNLPLIEDFPMIGIVYQNRLKEIQDQLKDIQITTEKINELNESDNEDDEDKGCAYEHIKGFIENVNFCVENQLDMISFCH